MSANRLSSVRPASSAPGVEIEFRFWRLGDDVAGTVKNFCAKNGEIDPAFALRPFEHRAIEMNNQPRAPTR